MWCRNWIGVPSFPFFTPHSLPLRVRLIRFLGHVSKVVVAQLELDSRLGRWSGAATLGMQKGVPFAVRRRSREWAKPTAVRF
jgi:hypothetical protein